MKLLLAHLEDLRRSGLTAETIEAAGLYSESNPDSIAKIIRCNRNRAVQLGPSLVIPYRHRDGSTNSYARIKPDHPRKSDDSTVKYESPRDGGNHIYIPPRSVAAINDPHHPLLLSDISHLGFA